MPQGNVLHVGGPPTGDPLCPKCGKRMLPTTGGNFCPSCGATDRAPVPYTDTATPRLGRPVASMETMALAGNSLLASDLKLAPAREDRPAPARPHPTPTPRPIIRIPSARATPARPAPKAAEPLAVPRCRSCSAPLDMDEMSEGECRRCVAQRAAPKAADDRGARAIALAELITGLLGLMAALWASTLVLVRMARSNPDTWGASQSAVAGSRAAVAVLAIVASAAWIGGRRWAGGIALCLGPLAAIMAIAGLLGGAFLGDLAAASAWMLALVAGTAMSLTAAGPTAAFGRAEDEPAEGAGRAIAGAIALFLAAVASTWLVVTIAGQRTTMPEDLLALVFASTGAAAAVVAGVLLLAKPPRGTTSAGAIVGASIAVCTPAVGVLVSRVPDLFAGVLAPVAGVGEVVSLGALSGIAVDELAPAAVALYACGILAGLVLAPIALAGSHRSRGGTLAGFALAWSCVWGAGLACAIF